MAKGKVWKDASKEEVTYKKKLKHKKLEPYNRKEAKYGKASN